ncbi:YrhB domain-containing protein [Streptomyces sp. NBC_00151]|uniref:YrhB domain-containing protein n=1 Tax=Streptomyces sp. NBC_00151 TaxID=2975669 RepID=UPI002DD8B877|nr:YrhB domain-containing protein [Streptomyces sp. NBC_00151]WRZ36946.1 YrhB family protein [Streptomyces sp. NBC_00151]
MISRESAISRAEAELERAYLAELAAYGQSVPAQVTRVVEHELGWIVFWDAREYVRTCDPRHSLLANGPYLVDKQDGSLHQIPVVDAVTGAWENDYLTRVKGQELPGLVDALHDELRSTADAQGRAHALRLLRRRIPALSIRAAATYADALAAGQSPPADLLALAVEALPRPKEPVALGVRTITEASRSVSVPAPLSKQSNSTAQRRRQTPAQCSTRHLGTYRELEPDRTDAPSIHDSIATEPRSDEAKLIAYLRSGTRLTVCGTASYDELRGDGTLIGENSLRTDGTWFWNSDLAYYVKTYHLALDDRFVARAAGSAWRPRHIGTAEMLALCDQLCDAAPWSW